MVDGEWIYGETHHREINGTRSAITTFGEESKSMVPGSFGEAIDALKDIYDSGNLLLIRAISTNLAAFHLTVQQEKRMRD